jgi:hypothetical protein
VQIVIGQVNAHPSVQNLVPESKKMIFIPPPSFRLCTYVVGGVNRIMPLRGYYQMKVRSSGFFLFCFVLYFFIFEIVMI